MHKFLSFQGDTPFIEQWGTRRQKKPLQTGVQIQWD